MEDKIATERQLLRFGGTMLHQVPADLTADVIKDWLDDPEALGQFLAGLHEGPIGQVQTREFVVLIDPMRTVEQWVAAGRYDWSNENLTTPNFGQFLTVRKDATEPYRQKVVAFNIGRSADIEKAKRIRNRLKLKPIGFEHEAAVGEQHPEAQRELNWLVNPDAVWVSPDGSRDVSSLYGHPGRRSFFLSDAGGTWRGRTWFFGLSELP